MTGKPDYDFALGFMLILAAWVNWAINIYFGFTTHNPFNLLGAVLSLVWFLFAPVYISRAFCLDQWTTSKWGNSIWSAIMWERNYIHEKGEMME